MASEGPIDKLNIEVGVTPDLSGLDAAKAQAAAKGQQTGEAFADGFKEGAEDVFNPFGGKKGRPDTENVKTVPPTPPKNPGTADPNLADVPDSGGLKNPLGVIGLLTAQFDRFVAMGEMLGSTLNASTKQQLELQQAISQMAAVIAQSNSLQQSQFKGRTEGNKNVGSFNLDMAQDLDAKNVALQQQLDDPSITTQMRDIVEGAVYGSADMLGPLGSPVGFLGRMIGKFTGEGGPRREQVQRQIDENKASIARHSNAARAIQASTRSQFTMEGVLESEAGLSPGAVGGIGPVDRVGEEILREAFRGSPDMMNTLINLNSGSLEQQQKRLIEAIKGTRPLEVR